MKCTQCNFGPQQKCRHEAACSKMLSECGLVTLIDNGDMQERNARIETDIVQMGDDGSGSEYEDEENGTTTAGGIHIGDSTAMKSGPDGGGGKHLYQPVPYMRSENTRPLYMFRSVKKLTDQLTDLIGEWDRSKGGLCFEDPEGWICAGTVRGANGDEVICDATNEQSTRVLPRKVTLYTLNHDVLSVVLKDWVCRKCGFENRYTGEAHGIFPAAKFRAYTVELLYFWMHECLGRGISFRSMFELTSNLQSTRSYRRKVEMGRLGLLALEFKRNRRLSNETIRKFCENIDVKDSSVCTANIFSFSNYEVELEESDCQQLGLAKKPADLKRLKAVVMDGKAIGALREFPEYKDNVQKLVCAKGLL